MSDNQVVIMQSPYVVSVSEGNALVAREQNTFTPNSTDSVVVVEQKIQAVEITTGAWQEIDPVAMQYVNQSVKTDASPTFDGATFTDEVRFKRDVKIYLDGL